MVVQLLMGCWAPKCPHLGPLRFMGASHSMAATGIERKVIKALEKGLDDTNLFFKKWTICSEKMQLSLFLFYETEV
uniref:Uncharacterized protein n=1 Tax=Salvator merianae TaxID=96440 RepID=A0A8D0B9E3_SALMN